MTDDGGSSGLSRRACSQYRAIQTWEDSVGVRSGAASGWLGRQMGTVISRSDDEPVCMAGMMATVQQMVNHP